MKAQCKVYGLIGIISLLVLIMGCVTCALAETPITEFEYTVNGDSVSITHYLGTSPVVEVPAMIEGKPVISVKLGYADGEIQSDSFTGLVSVTLPDTVTELSDYAFARCFSLHTINGLEHITHIGCNAFNGAGIKKLAFSENLVAIGAYSFLNSSLEELTIPDNVLFHYFTWNGDINSLQAPSSNMLDAQELRDVRLIETGQTPTLQVIDHVVYSADGTKLLNVLPSYTDFCFRVPDHVTSIDNYAFSHAIQVEVLELPQSVVNLQESSFAISHLHTIYVEAGSIAESTASSWAGNIQVIVIGTDEESVQQIINRIVATETNDGMSDWEKAYALHNWLRTNVVYDETYEKTDATSVFLEGTGVCDAFAKAYCALLTQANISSRRVECYMQGVGHAINAVQIDGHWIYVDCTNDTPGTIGEPNKLFGFDEDVLQVFYSANTGIVANTCTYYAPYVLGELNTDLSVLIGYIQSRLDTGETAFDFDPLDVFSNKTDIRIAPLSSLLGEQTWTVSGTEIPLTCAYHDGRLWITTQLHSPYEYESYEDGICLTAYTGTDSIVVVPSVYDGRTVCATRETFRGNKNITQVVLPDTLVNLGQSTFANCDYLESVSLPSSMKSIGATAFWNCILLQGDFTVPQGVTQIGASAFTNCASLKKITIPGTVKTIEESTFFGCSSLQEVLLGEGVETISEEAFCQCLSLKTIQLPNTLKVIDFCAFERCGIESLHIPASVESIGPRLLEDSVHFNQITISENNPYYMAIDGMILSKDGKNLVTGTPAISEKLYIPNTVEVIKANSFVYNLTLKELYIPSSVRIIERYAFWNCQNLMELYMEDGCETIETRAFGFPGNSGQLKKPHLASTITFIGEEAFRASVSLKFLALPASMTSLPNSIVTLNCTIYIHESMQQMARQNATIEVFGKAGTYAETYAAENGYVFTESSINDPDQFNADFSYTAWEDGIQINYTSLSGEEIAIPMMVNGLPVRSIAGYYLFYQCSQTKITLPEGLKNIGSNTFRESRQLVEVNIPSTVQTIGDSAFEQCNNLTGEINLPEGLVSIGKRAFYLTGITKLHVPSTLQTWTEAFYNCSALREVSLADGLGMIPDSAFNSASALSSISIPKSVKSIGNHAFAFSGLTTIRLPSGLETVGDYAFYWCRSLTDIWIPNSVTSIGTNCFTACAVTIHCRENSYAMSYAQQNNIQYVIEDPLTSESALHLPENLVSIQSGAFTGVMAEVVFIPSTVTFIADDAFDHDIIFVLTHNSTLIDWCEEHGYIYVVQ